jgi:DNA-binding NarL/FixJ family response regulator
MQTIAKIGPSDILLIDDHILVAEGFKEILTKVLPLNSRVDVLYSLDEATQKLQNHNYKFLVTDLNIPGQDVLGFISHCRTSHSNIIIIVITAVLDPNSIKACLEAGANGYLSKAVDIRDIILALEFTYSGKKFISSDLTGRLADSILSKEKTELTSKELEVLILIASGKSTVGVAETLFISPVTVMTHKRNILRKLGLHSATEMVKYAYDNNLV